MMFRITDNLHLSISESNIFKEKYPQIYKTFLNRSIKSLSKEENLLICPDSISDIKDIDDRAMLFKEVNGKIAFQNLIGFFSSGDESLMIHSRFSSSDNDYFLYYMLNKVLNINIVNVETYGSNREGDMDLLKYIFPQYLNAAMKKGVFKQYQRVKYNDSNIKGIIDISRHIKLNTPFTGKVAYSTREFVSDNYLMELVRHAIEFMMGSLKDGDHILNSSELTN